MVQRHSWLQFLITWKCIFLFSCKTRYVYGIDELNVPDKFAFLVNFRNKIIYYAFLPNGITRAEKFGLLAIFVRASKWPQAK